MRTEKRIQNTVVSRQKNREEQKRERSGQLSAISQEKKTEDRIQHERKNNHESAKNGKHERREGGGAGLS